jgi:flagellar biosynthetic protein FliQ
MTPESVLEIGQNALYVTIMLVSVLLIPALIIGLLVSVFQAATQINEVTLSFIPKLIVTMLVIVIAGPWILRTLVIYTQRLFEDIPNLIGQ